MQLTRSPAITPALAASAQQIATHLGDMLGAQACYLALVEQTGHAPRLLATSGPSGELPSWRAIEGATLARRALTRRESLVSCVGRWSTVALPLICDARPIGAALLLYATEPVLDAARSTAAAQLSACALDAARQIATLHLQAEEIEERTRVREIQVSRNLIRGVIDSIQMGLALLDPNGIVLAANRALSDRFGLEPAALVGLSYSEALGSWTESSAAQTFASGVAGRLRRTIVQMDGARALLEIVSIPLLDAEGHPHQVVEVWEDITERVALQTQLIRVEKLAAIGQLAASIAHEVGNPLQAIQGFLALFLEQCPPEVTNQHYLKLAEEEIERIVQVLARLRDLYRPRADVVAPLDMNALIENVLLLTSKQLERGRIRMVCELDPALPKIYAVVDQLKQVLLNLVLNAAEAMAEGGLLHIQTYTQDNKLGGRALVVTVTDTGPGIPPDQLPYIFDGLHTTKERGMGLGLYTSKVIVERHMGRISAQSIPGEGTTFSLLLPLTSEENAISMAMA